MGRLAHDRVKLALVGLSSLLLVWLVQPLAQPILWAIIASILFKPAERRVRSAVAGRRNWSTLVVLAGLSALIVVPGTLLAGAVVGEARYYAGTAGELDLSGIIRTINERLPGWAADPVRRSGILDLNAWTIWLRSSVATGAGSVATWFLALGQGTLGVLLSWGVMLYLAFFLMRDGDDLWTAALRATPSLGGLRDRFVCQFVAVTRAMILGSFVVALVQGTIGGLLFWSVGLHGAALWGAVMSLASLIPAVGSGLVWAPIGLYLLLSGEIVRGLIVLACGAFIISLVDNLLRPALVGRSTRMPDYLVLVATIGGLQLFGFIGLVVGPVIAAFCLLSWRMLLEDRPPSPVSNGSDVPVRTCPPVQGAGSPS